MGKSAWATQTRLVETRRCNLSGSRAGGSVYLYASSAGGAKSARSVKTFAIQTICPNVREGDRWGEAGELVDRARSAREAV